MTIKHFKAEYKNLLFRIEGVYPEGAYIFIKENETWKYDYLQDDIEMCKKFAHDLFGVEYNMWIELLDDTPSLL